MPPVLCFQDLILLGLASAVSADNVPAARELVRCIFHLTITHPGLGSMYESVRNITMQAQSAQVLVPIGAYALLCAFVSGHSHSRTLESCQVSLAQAQRGALILGRCGVAVDGMRWCGVVQMPCTPSPPCPPPPPPFGPSTRPGGGGVTWPLNNQKSIGNHRSRRRRRKNFVGYTRIQGPVVWCPSPPGDGGDCPGPRKGATTHTGGTVVGGGGGDGQGEGGGAAHQTTGLCERGNDTSKSTGRSGRQNAATRHNMRREERVTVQGPVKEQQPDGMSHRGGTGGWTGGGGVHFSPPPVPLNPGSTQQHRQQQHATRTSRPGHPSVPAISICPSPIQRGSPRPVGALGMGATSGGAPPTSTRSWAKKSHFSTKTAPNPIHTGRMHRNRLGFVVSRSPFVALRCALRGRTVRRARAVREGGQFRTRFPRWPSRPR